MVKKKTYRLPGFAQEALRPLVVLPLAESLFHDAHVHGELGGGLRAAEQFERGVEVRDGLVQVAHVIQSLT